MKWNSFMTTDEKNLLRKEIMKYIKENCYYSDGYIKRYDLWLVGWVANEFNDRKNAMKVLINNEYGLLGIFFINTHWNRMLQSGNL